MRKALLLALLVGALAYVTYVLWQANQEALPEEERARRVEKPVILEGMEFYEFFQGKEELRLWAENAKLYEQRGLGVLKGVKGRIRQEEGKRIDFQAKRAVVLAKKERLQLRGKVLVALTGQGKLETEELDYDHGQGLIHNQVKSLLTSGKDRYQGSSLSYDLDKESLHMADPLLLLEGP